MISIVDYGLGNISAFENIYRSFGFETKRVTCSEELSDATKLVLPGVGSFDWAMQKLNASGMRLAIDDLVMKQGVSVLGVCVGMQIMCCKSDEGHLDGLGWFDAKVVKFRSDDGAPRLPLPHMGWNTAEIKGGCSLFKDLTTADFYFLHSYYVDAENEKEIIGRSEYKHDFCCALSRENIYAVQFHPEKSHDSGLKLLKNFAEYC